MFLGIDGKYETLSIYTSLSVLNHFFQRTSHDTVWPTCDSMNIIFALFRELGSGDPVEYEDKHGKNTHKDQDEDENDEED